MPSSYTTSLRLTLPATGELSGTWGTTVNTGITELTDAAIAGYVSIAMTDADYTLTVANGATDQARRMMLNMTGTLSAARNVICPTASKLYVIKNATTGGFAITLKTSGGTGISIPNGQSMLLMCDGTNVVDAVTQFSSGAFTNLSYTGTLTGGTGVVALGTNQFYKDASGNVGIGTTGPSGYGKLAVVGNVGVTTDGTTVMTLRSNAAVTTIGSFNNASGSTLVFNTNTAGSGEAERMRLDSSGNLGLGVTPSAWGGGAKTLDMTSTGSFEAIGANSTSISYNRYYNGTNNIYKTTGSAGIYALNSSGQHVWYTAPSGTAGNAISFTQAMTLDASGNLLVGATTAAGKLHVDNGNAIVRNGEYQVSNSVSFSAKGAVAAFNADSVSGGLVFKTEAASTLTERARITSGGILCVGSTSFNKAVRAGFRGDSTTVATVEIQNESATGTMLVFCTNGESTVGSVSFTSSGVTYNTTSDHRLKTLIAPVTGSGARLDALNPVEYEWKETGHRARGFFAHEFQQVYADSVTGEKDAVDEEGKPVYQAMQASTAEVIADLVAEIKSLRARVAALEAN